MTEQILPKITVFLKKNKTQILIPLATLIILYFMGLLMFASIINDASTSDEPPHILSGYAALKYGHDYIDPEHPLFAKSLAAAPLLFQDIKLDRTDPGYANQKNDFDIGKMFGASRRFLNYSGNDPDGILLSTRIPMIMLTVFFGVIIFLFTKKLFGSIAAFIATFFFATEPNILAHGSLVNTDLAASGFVVMTVFALWIYYEKQSTKRLVFLILSLSLALLSKYSTFVIFPLILISMVTIYLTQSRKPWKHLIYTVIGVLLIISLFYGVLSFRDRGILGFLPIQYFTGLAIVLDELSGDLRFSYLLGESYYGSRWYYFPVLFLAKTQITTLLSLLLFVIYIITKKINLSRKQLFLILLIPITFFGLALTTKFNIGVRHILPIYPFIFIFGAGALVTLIRLMQKATKKKISLAGITLIILIIVVARSWSSVSTFPGYLSYYNIAFGGTENGWKVSNDSNYDWGQDIKRLDEYVRNNNIESIALDNYTGHYSSEYYNIPTTNLTPNDTNYKGYLALSTSVIAFNEDSEKNYSWVIDKYKPIAKAGYSIFIYKIE